MGFTKGMAKGGTIMRLIGAVVVICGFGFSGATAYADLPESVVACIEGPEAQMIAYGDHTSGCTISPATDLDRFTFEGAAGDDIRIVVRGLTDNLDPRVIVRDPVGTQIADMFCTASTFGRCAVNVPLQLAMTGTYTVFVQESGIDNTGSFILHLERVFPSDLSTTKKVFNTSVTEAINHAADLDVFFFEGVGGTEIQLSMSGQTDNLDPSLQIFQPDGTSLHSQSCSASTFGTCSFNTPFLVLPQTGVYTLLLWDAGFDNTGGYQLSLNCIFGDCECLEVDFTGDGIVGINDFLDLLAAWGPCPDPCTNGEVNLPDDCPADIIRDCNVGILDFLKVLSSWGPCGIP